MLRSGVECKDWEIVYRQCRASLVILATVATHLRLPLFLPTPQPSHLILQIPHPRHRLAQLMFKLDCSPLSRKNTSRPRSRQHPVDGIKDMGFERRWRMKEHNEERLGDRSRNSRRISPSLLLSMPKSNICSSKLATTSSALCPASCSSN